MPPGASPPADDLREAPSDAYGWVPPMNWSTGIGTDGVTAGASGVGGSAGGSGGGSGVGGSVGGAGSTTLAGFVNERALPATSAAAAGGDVIECKLTGGDDLPLLTGLSFRAGSSGAPAATAFDAGAGANDGRGEVDDDARVPAGGDADGGDSDGVAGPRNDGACSSATADVRFGGTEPLRGAARLAT
jgi:hypothetical protein